MAHHRQTVLPLPAYSAGHARLHEGIEAVAVAFGQVLSAPQRQVHAPIVAVSCRGDAMALIAGGGEALRDRVFRNRQRKDADGMGDWLCAVKVEEPVHARLRPVRQL